MPRFQTKEEFIQKARTAHAGKYSYANVDYVSSKEKVKITCVKHGDFLQEPRLHLSGKGCPECGKTRQGSHQRFNAEEWIRKARSRYSKKYTYGKYTGIESTVQVKCPIHQFFTVSPSKHLQGKECPECEKEFAEERRRERAKQREKEREFKLAEERKEREADRERRRKVAKKREVLNREGLKKKRAEATQKRKEERLFTTKRKVLERAYEVHGETYVYDLTNYTNTHDIVSIKCAEHGWFEQSMSAHLNQRQGCPKCAKYRTAVKLTKSTKHFISKSILKYGDTYSYKKAVYSGKNNEIVVTCKKHGDFKVLAANHMHYKTNYGGCPECRPARNRSILEQKIFEWMKKLDVGHIEQNNRNVMSPYEIDILCWSKKVGVEINGMYWHGEHNKEPKYHMMKARRAKKVGLKLLQFWESELENKSKICKSMIKNALGLSRRIYARQLKIKQANADFFEHNHLAGSARASVYYGLFDGETCLAAMSFGRPRFNKNYEWELIRYANTLNTIVVGGASRLFKHFVRTHDPKNVLSYADRRISQGNMYKVLGFKFSHKTPPNYGWYKNLHYLTRYQTQKHKLSKLIDDFDSNKSETENMRDAGWSKIYDAGNLAYVWTF